MRIIIILIALVITGYGGIQAQRACVSADYNQQLLRNNPSLGSIHERVENFIKENSSPVQAREMGGQSIIRIPVVFHVLYHTQAENIGDDRIQTQLTALNEAFRRTGADTSKTPSVFRSVAADCEIEFVLAISDPTGRSTSGVIRKYTPVSQWQMSDDMKFSSTMGSDGWNAAEYLNIWVCNVKGVAGYASFPGGETEKDGMVINYRYLGKNGSSGYDQGKTAVHEVGHWLGLKHIWGDADCGDDLVHDTPKQAFYNTGCPSGTRITCGNGPTGDMYMNYMDFTNDGCINLFTEGQKNRMRSLFQPGGVRRAILSSRGLQLPTIMEMPLPEEAPRWLYSKVYPNPASSEITLDVSYDARWIGKQLAITNSNGQQMMQVVITSKIQTINISRLAPGIYFISGKKEDGETIRFKIVKI